MSQTAAAMAEEINKKAKGLKVDTIEVWGFQPVRSGDWVYVILSAKAEGDRLDLVIDDESQGLGPTGSTRLTVSIFQPQELKASKKGITIGSAGKMTWGKDFKGVRDGEKPEVTTQSPPDNAADHTALFLKSI
jgi:hypothetical protein